jgi:hypothetical protein
MATSAQYASTPRVSSAALTTADTSRTAPSTVGTVFTAGSSGSRIDAIEIVGTATTTATMARLFIYDGSTYRLWKEVPVLAVTPSSTLPVFDYRLNAAINPELLPLVLPTGYSLRAAVNDTQTGVNVLARGGDF